jgi:hypothetical protein
MKRIKLRGLRDHWIDKAHLMLHASIQCLH